MRRLSKIICNTYNLGLDAGQTWVSAISNVTEFDQRELPCRIKPMPLSNAERQRRYRQRLKARASGALVVEQAQLAVERAIHALWAYHERPSPSGIAWSEIDGCRTLEAYRSELERSPANLLQTCRAFLPDFSGLTVEEATAIADVIALADVLRLSAPTKVDFAVLADVD